MRYVPRILDTFLDGPLLHPEYILGYTDNSSHLKTDDMEENLNARHPLRHPLA